MGTGSLDLDNVLSATVEDTVFRGPSTRYDVRWNGRRLSVEAQNVSRNPPHSRGDDVVVGWNADTGIIYRE
ncbi:TOBE domain-containing protein [Halospeciosus flavus]|uniref:TOBE domain-containing protein n=1 Tax=Halospeciosus flavus TaxID=3032283 RepID=UPI0036097ED9